MWNEEDDRAKRLARQIAEFGIRDKVGHGDKWTPEEELSTEDFDLLVRHFGNIGFNPWVSFTEVGSRETRYAGVAVKEDRGKLGSKV